MTPSITQYTSEDRTGFLALHNELLSGMDAEVFDWKYLQHPYVDTPQIVVAKDDDTVVGAVGCLYVPLEVDGQRIKGSHTMDIMIKEEYRSPKLFKRLVDKLRGTYDDVAVEFGSGGRETRIAWERLAGRDYQYVDRHVRIQRIEDLLGEDPSLLLAGLGTLAGGALRIGLRVRDWVAERRFESYPVSRENGYVDSAFDIFDGLSRYPVSIARDSDFWSWRVSDPRIDTYTYQATDGGESVASVLVSINKSGQRNDCVISLQEFSGGKGGVDGLLSIYSKIVRDFSNVAVIRSTDNSSPDVYHRSGLSHQRVATTILNSTIFKHLSKRLNGNPEHDEIGEKEFGCKWLDDTYSYDTTKWEYSNMLMD